MPGHLSGEVFIRRAPEKVFDFVADGTNEPRYNRAMVAAEKLTGGPVGVGTRFAATMRRGRRRFRMTSEVTGYERPSRLASRTTMDLMDVVGSVTFTPAGGGTRLRWDWDIQPKGWFRLVAAQGLRFSARWEAANWRRLKQHLEQGDLQTGGHIALPSARGPLAAYLAVPEGDGPWPAVVWSTTRSA